MNPTISLVTKVEVAAAYGVEVAKKMEEIGLMDHQ